MKIEYKLLLPPNSVAQRLLHIYASEKEKPLIDLIRKAKEVEDSLAVDGYAYAICVNESNLQLSTANDIWRIINAESPSVEISDADKTGFEKKFRQLLGNYRNLPDKSFKSYISRKVEEMNGRKESFITEAYVYLSSGDSDDEVREIYIGHGYIDNEIECYVRGDEMYGRIHFALSNRHDSIYLDGRRYRILHNRGQIFDSKFKYNNEKFGFTEGRGSTQSIHDLTDTNNLPLVYISPKDKTLSCVINSHKIDTVIAFFCVGYWDNCRSKRMNISYCNKCEKYFLSSERIRSLREKHGLLWLPIVESSTRLSKSRGQGGDFFASFNTESKLKCYGYHADGSIKAKKRKEILKTLVLCRLMSLPEIQNHIGSLIQLREKSKTRDYSAAISRWRSDLQYLEQLEVPYDQVVRGILREK